MLITRPGRTFARSTSQTSPRSGVFIPQIHVDRAEETLDLLLRSDRPRLASHAVKPPDAVELLRPPRRDQRPTGCRTLRATFWRLESCNQRGSTRLWRQARSRSRGGPNGPDPVPGPNFIDRTLGTLFIDDGKAAERIPSGVELQKLFDSITVSETDIISETQLAWRHGDAVATEAAAREEGFWLMSTAHVVCREMRLNVITAVAAGPPNSNAHATIVIQNPP